MAQPRLLDSASVKIADDSSIRVGDVANDSAVKDQDPPRRHKNGGRSATSKTLSPVCGKPETAIDLI
jgi:hypothetical protein